MALRIKYTGDCDCGGTMSSTTLDLSQDPGEEVVIDLDILGEFTIKCGECGDESFVPNISDYIVDSEELL